MEASHRIGHRYSNNKGRRSVARVWGAGGFLVMVVTAELDALSWASCRDVARIVAETPAGRLRASAECLS